MMQDCRTPTSITRKHGVYFSSSSYVWSPRLSDHICIRLFLKYWSVQLHIPDISLIKTWEMYARDESTADAQVFAHEFLTWLQGFSSHWATRARVQLGNKAWLSVYPKCVEGVEVEAPCKAKSTSSKPGCVCTGSGIRVYQCELEHRVNPLQFRLKLD